MDLNAEFEFERIDYLDTIRKQEKQLALYQQLLEKVQPVLRRDCNYYNLDKVGHCRVNPYSGGWGIGGGRVGCRLKVSLAFLIRILLTEPFLCEDDPPKNAHILFYARPLGSF